MFEVQLGLERVICCTYWRRTSERNPTSTVTYINDCKYWRTDPYGYLLEELVMTFHNDLIDGISIVEWCQAVVGSDTEEKMMRMMMEALITHTQVSNLQWIVIYSL